MSSSVLNIMRAETAVFPAPPLCTSCWLSYLCRPGKQQGRLGLHSVLITTVLSKKLPQGGTTVRCRMLKSLYYRDESRKEATLTRMSVEVCILVET